MGANLSGYQQRTKILLNDLPVELADMDVPDPIEIDKKSYTEPIIELKENQQEIKDTIDQLKQLIVNAELSKNQLKNILKSNRSNISSLEENIEEAEVKTYEKDDQPIVANAKEDDRDQTSSKDIEMPAHEDDEQDSHEDEQPRQNQAEDDEEEREQVSNIPLSSKDIDMPRIEPEQSQEVEEEQDQSHKEEDVSQEDEPSVGPDTTSPNVSDDIHGEERQEPSNGPDVSNDREAQPSIEPDVSNDQETQPSNGPDVSNDREAQPSIGPDVSNDQETQPSNGPDVSNDQETQPSIGPDVSNDQEPSVGPDTTSPNVSDDIHGEERQEPGNGPDVSNDREAQPSIEPDVSNDREAQPSIGPDVSNDQEPSVGPDTTSPNVLNDIDVEEKHGNENEEVQQDVSHDEELSTNKEVDTTSHNENEEVQQDVSHDEEPATNKKVDTTSYNENEEVQPSVGPLSSKEIEIPGSDEQNDNVEEKTSDKAREEQSPDTISNEIKKTRTKKKLKTYIKPINIITSLKYKEPAGILKGDSLLTTETDGDQYHGDYLINIPTQSTLNQHNPELLKFSNGTSDLLNFTTNKTTPFLSKDPLLNYDEFNMVNYNKNSTLNQHNPELLNFSNKTSDLLNFTTNTTTPFLSKDPLLNYDEFNMTNYNKNSTLNPANKKLLNY